MCADTTVQEEEEEDPSDGQSDFAHDDYALLLSDLSTEKSYTSSFSQLTTPPAVHIISTTKKSYHLSSI
jgi:hypothetical protein